jgi:hypothetical protein
MKLNLIQRWAVKLGIPISLLNEFAHEYYGYPIPNAEGKYPEWWYREQRVPITFRDVEVPKEIVKKSKGRNRFTSTPKVYVKVKEGKVVEILGKEPIQTVPDFGSQSEQQRYHDIYRYWRGDEGFQGQEHDEIVHRGVEVRKEDLRTEQRLSRTTSVPHFSRTRKDDDIMSLIHDNEDTISQQGRTTVGAIVNPGPLLYDEEPSSPPFIRVHRSTTTPARRHKNFSPSPPLPAKSPSRGPALPRTPRPVAHQRTPTVATDNIIPGYSYYSTAANRTSLRHRREEIVRPMEHPEEDDMSDWSGYDEGEWEEFGRTSEFRKAAAERLRQYRHEN